MNRAAVKNGDEQTVRFMAGDWTLEGRFCAGETDRAVAIAHPHPRMGGDMDNPLVLAVAAVFGRQGYATLRFNFRGVGESQGRFEEGLGERQDLIAAVAYLKNLQYGKIWVAGYSFGAWVCSLALKALPGLGGAVLIAPPIALANWEGGALSGLPCLVVCGDRDFACDIETLRRGLPRGTTTLTILTGADHFFGGREEALRQAIDHFLRQGGNESPAAAPGC